MFLTTNSIGYVEAGCIVNLVGGFEAFASAAKAKAWNTFLSHFNLSVDLLHSWLFRRFNPGQAERFFKSSMHGTHCIFYCPRLA